MKAFIDSIPIGPFLTNCYVIGCEETKEAAIIDCGGDYRELKEVAENHSMEIKKIFLTHAHFDHVAGLDDIEEIYKESPEPPISLHKDDISLYRNAKEMGRMFGYNIGTLPNIRYLVDDGDSVQIGNLKGYYHHVPGHTPGCSYIHFPGIKTIFSGDFIFRGSIGRVDFPGSSPSAMRSSINKFLHAEIPDDTRILCGHGPETTYGLEVRTNPYLNSNW